MSGIRPHVLESVARDALRAPSILNTQPWAWRVAARGSLELRADRSRQLTVADPQGKMLLLSCGAALHHARVSLAARGFAPKVRRLVSSFSDDLIAEVAVGAARPASRAEWAMYQAIERRHTDRRPFSEQPVPTDALLDLAEAAEAEGAFLHRVRADQMPMLAMAATEAGVSQMADPEHRIELMRWVNRPEWSSDGLPPTAAVQQVARRVPVRQLALPPQEGIPVPSGGDIGASYLVVFGEGGEPRDWLIAGEAVSSVLLVATGLGLAVAPISDVIEEARPRELVASLLPGRADPYIVLRCGYAAGDRLGAIARRDADEVIESDTDDER